MIESKLPTGQLAHNLSIDQIVLAHIKLFTLEAGPVTNEDLESLFVLRGFSRKKAAKRIVGNCTQRLRKAGRIEHVRGKGWVVK